MKTRNPKIPYWKVLFSAFFPYFNDSYNIFRNISDGSRTLFDELNKEESKELASERLHKSIKFGANVDPSEVEQFRNWILSDLSLSIDLSMDDTLELIYEAFLRELKSFWGALLTVLKTGDRRILSRFAIYESKRFRSLVSMILNDSEVFSVILRLDYINKPTVYSMMTYIAEQLNIRARYIEVLKCIGINFLDYIECFPSRLGKWKLVNRVMTDGYVVFLNTKSDRNDLIRVLESAVEKRIKEKFEELYEHLKSGNMEFPNWVEDLAHTIRGYYEKEISSQVIKSGEESHWPPCMRILVNDIKSGKSLTHHARFAVTTFLYRIGWDEEKILELYKNFPDYDEKTATYQVRHIMGKISGKSYSIPACDTMLSYGICYKEADNLGLCGKIKHPMQYYEKAFYILSNKKKNRSKKRPINRKS